jgi:dimethylhistidine N-methyltransferase
VDISASAVQPAADAIARDFPHLLVAPVVGDFTRRLVLPPSLGSLRKTAFFPGSTIGNFPPAAAAEFMARVRSLVGEGGAFIVGVDMVKDEKVLVAAYDDNLNLLRRINRELGGEFDLSAFAHRAIFNTEESRIEMHIVSLRDQVVFVGSRSFAFARGETIHTENSYKYTPERFQALAEKAGWRMVRRWVAPQPSFAVFLLSA